MERGGSCCGRGDNGSVVAVWGGRAAAAVPRPAAGLPARLLCGECVPLAGRPSSSCMVVQEAPQLALLPVPQASACRLGGAVGVPTGSGPLLAPLRRRLAGRVRTAGGCLAPRAAVRGWAARQSVNAEHRGARVAVPVPLAAAFAPLHERLTSRAAASSGGGAGQRSVGCWCFWFRGS